ncbi:antibiotic biosynthesis monooxygenase [Achromobacter piechaudii]|uniref:antibiotic biosynthesis monooxygenase family protein n=1 Tax=Achromobacter piechaudii TaxID=72556 RepID=UPI000681D160|nr:antibiotic biosynthesis monooxygenase [Achromobacter piechaudii]KNY12238.1 antibiotic biosynthesis monooxygenase [Achromobacter piechaudii]
MIAVIFEVEPANGDAAPYLDIAAGLIDELRTIDGFLSVERFQSLTTPGKLLSLSFWRDEDAVKRWRTLDSHRRAQQAGRGGVFQNYRLRVAQVLRDYGMNDRDQAPGDSRDRHG